MTVQKDCNREWVQQMKTRPIEVLAAYACGCKGCIEKASKMEKHLDHPFYGEVKDFVGEVEQQQILKGAEKYTEPFNPDSWSGDELAVHAMQELRDGQVYVTGMRDRMRKQAEQIETLKAEVEYWRLKAKTGSEYEKWKEVAEQNGICRRTFNDRVNKGLPYEMAATAPLSNTSPKKYRKDENK